MSKIPEMTEAEVRAAYAEQILMFTRQGNLITELNNQIAALVAALTRIRDAEGRMLVKKLAYDALARRQYPQGGKS